MDTFRSSTRTAAYTPKWIGATRDGLEDFTILSVARSRMASSTPSTPIRFACLTSSRKALRSIHVPGSSLLNGIAVADDGTIFASNTRPDWKLYKVTKDGKSSVLVADGKLNIPNGVAMDPDGNVVVVNIGNRDVITYSPSGKLVRVEQSGERKRWHRHHGRWNQIRMQRRHGSVSRIRLGKKAEIIASGIPKPRRCVTTPFSISWSSP